MRSLFVAGGFCDQPVCEEVVDAAKITRHKMIKNFEMIPCTLMILRT
jgi:hypothetical protein